MCEHEVIQETRQLRGSVKWFDPVKGFGFILPEDGGPDILLHANVLRNFGQSSIADNSAIEITALETERGLQAVEVISITLPEGSDDSFAEMPDGEVLENIDDLELEPARIKWFDKGKGFGFANVFGNPEDIFIHVEILRRCGLSDLQAGEAICLAAQDGKRGRMAVLVKTWDSVIEVDTH